MSIKHKVLDKGYVELVLASGAEELVVESARMSTQKGFLGWDARECDCADTTKMTVFHAQECRLCNGKRTLPGDQKLLEHLYKNGHMTPFEMCDVTFEVKAPIMVFREWHRHRTFSYNEMSARYSQLPNEFYVPTPERVVRQSKSNKQGGDEPLPLDFGEACADGWHGQQVSAYESYSELIDCGVERGLARLNLPVSIYSVMRVKGNLRNWLQFLTLRCAPAAQWEIRQYAMTIALKLAQLFPRTMELWKNYTYKALTLSYEDVMSMVLGPGFKIERLTSHVKRVNEIDAFKLGESL